MLNDIPLQKKLTFLIMAVSTAVLLLASSIFTIFEMISLRRQLVQETITLAQIIGNNSTAALVFEDSGDAEEILNGLIEKKSIITACLFTKNGDVLAHYGKDGLSHKNLKVPTEEMVTFTMNSLTVYRDVILNDRGIGGILIKTNLDEINLLLKQTIGMGILAGLVSMMFALIISSKIQKIISDPINKLAGIARFVSKEKKYFVRIQSHSNDEIGALYTAFNHMLQEIHDYSFHLEQKVEERTQKLSQSLEDLQQAQNQLIESEKLAALGGLVAGIAHEINTPIGVGITAASTFNEHLQTFQKLYAEGALTRKDLESFIKSGTYSNKIILSNLGRAAELVKSFKQVAVDQTNEERRRFYVRIYIQDIINSLNPTLKKTNLRVDVLGSDDVEIISYPGLLSQILTNLILNSIVHAYPNNQKGTITIRFSMENELFSLIFSDNGIGMDSSIVSHIFDPFFTTNRGSGGTGLGLYIVYTIITQTLKGSITCESEVGDGTTFIIQFK